jgi:hypothetical protein
MIRKENILKEYAEDIDQQAFAQGRKSSYDEDEVVTECCGANFYEPGYPDSDMCTSCGEHSGPMSEE